MAPTVEARRGVAERARARADASRLHHRLAAAAAAKAWACRSRTPKTLVETHGWVLDERVNVLASRPPRPTPRQHSAMQALARLTDHAIAADAGAASAS